VPAVGASLPSRLTHELVFVTGKGGVGKTTVATALALRAAERGRRVLLCEVSARSAFGAIFARPVGFDPSPVSDGVWASVCDANESLVSFLSRFVKVRRVARALVSNRVAWRFFEAAPGVLECVVLERIAWLAQHGHEGTRFDHVIVDLPASGHAVTYLGVPRRMAKLIRVGPLAESLTELADFLAHPERVGLYLVSQPEVVPVRETVELWQTAHDELEVAVLGVIVNRLRASGLPREIADALVAREDHELAPGSPVRAAALMASWERNERAALEALRTGVGALASLLPWLPEVEDEAELVRRMAAHLDDGPAIAERPA
jgi:hypothetical protein